MSAKKTEGNTWINVNSNDKKGHVNIYDKDPKGKHDTSIYVNIDYETGKFNITEKENGEKTTTDCSCYLTTACMRNLKNDFSDNCYQLDILRWFRDKFVSKVDIEHYYMIAPAIVGEIEKNENKNSIYNYIYNNVVLYCVRKIEENDFEAAYNRYKNSVIALENQFIKEKEVNKLVKRLV